MGSPSEKLKETIHFVCRKTGTGSKVLGAVRLQKILWNFDLRSFQATGYACTGAVFVRGFRGPYAPLASEAIVQLVRERRFFADTTKFFDNDKARLVGKGETNKSLFSSRELAWLQEAMREICDDRSTGSVDGKWHEVAWRIARLGEEIPFEATAVTIVRPSKEAIEAFKNDLHLAR
jgi:hypothetical protein